MILNENLFINGKQITDLIIPDGVTEIRDNAFAGISSLKTVTLPSSVTAIWSYAFYWCENLSDIYYCGTALQYGSIAMYYGNDSLDNAIKHFNYVPETYTATFIADGKVVKRVSFTSGAISISEPAIPVKEGYSGKWETYTLGSENITINAVYTKKQYIVSWVVNGNKTNVIYDYGDEIKLPAAPEYELHTFVKWSPDVPSTMPANNLVFTAQFRLTNSASVEIVNYNKYNGTTQDYKSSITFRAVVKYGHNLNWQVKGANYIINSDNSCTVVEATDDYTVCCTAFDADGNEVKSKTETIKIKHSFFDKLIAFFIGLFGSFKKIEQ